MNKIGKIFAFTAILSVLVSSIAYGYNYDLQADNATQTIVNVPYYYVDNNTSDTDSDPDKGTQSNFTAQQYGPDSVYDALTEDVTAEAIEDYIDVQSDVDSSSDVGTHSNFDNMKLYDSVYDTITETGGAGAGISKAGTDTAGHGTTSPLQWDHVLVSGSNRLVVILIGWENNGVCTVTGVTYGGQTCTEVIQNNAGSTYVNGAAIYYIDEDTLPSDGTNQVSVTFSAASTANFDAYAMEFTGVDLDGPEDWDETAEATPVDDTIENTVLSASADDLLVSVVDCGNLGTFSHGQSQNERVDYQAASSTFSCTDLIATGSLSTLESTYSVGANRLARMAAQWSPAPSSNYDLDLEIQFNNIADFLPTENLCIYMGTMGAEALNVSYWAGSSWSLLDSDLAALSWNNYTVSLIGANFTIRFETATLTGDSSADEYQVDAVLLQVSGVGSKEDPVDQQSDIDGSPDIGTHSNFTAQQYGPDSIYDTLTEEDTGGGSTTFGKTDVGASSRGFTGYLEASRYQCGQDFTVTKILLYLSGGASGYYARTAIYSDSSGAPGSLLGESAEQEVASDGWHEFSGIDVSVSQNTYYWLAFQISTSNLAYHYDTGAANQHAYIAYTYGSFPSTFGSPSYAAEAQSIYAASSASNYEIDVEIQWDDLPNSLPNEELCIKTGTFSGSETIQVKIWNNTGSSWDWIMNLTANQWNNVSITDWLTSNQFTIQFLGGNETGDLTEDTWEIDFAIIHIWNTENYEIDLEVQWTNVDYSESNEELCIYVGDVGTGSNNTHSLDATGGYMIVGDGTPDWGSTAGTISFWVKMDGTVQGRFWGQHGDMETRWAATNLVLDWGSTTTLTSATSFSANSWYFIAIVWDENNNNLFLYVGDETNPPTLDSNSLSGTWTYTTPLPTENRFMNGAGAIEPVDGHGDDLRYWNIARSLAELQSDYNTTLAGSESNLRSYFKLNDNFNDIGPDNNDGSGSGSYSFSTDVPFTSTNETLRVDVWNGSTWQNVFPQLSNGWNNATITAYLTSSTLTIRFKGNSETSDSAQDTWNIDASVIHAWT